MTDGTVLKGFYCHRKGCVIPVDDAAQKWFEMGIFDDVKRANNETYQKIILDMIGIRPSNYDIIYNLNEDEKAFAKAFAKKHEMPEGNFVIGLNTGAGRRWQNKKWTIEGYLNLISLIKRKLKGTQILLYGGPEEVERNKYLMEREDRLIDTGCSNSVREFGALLSLCDILVTGDTMALHVALALKKESGSPFWTHISGRNRTLWHRQEGIRQYGLSLLLSTKLRNNAFLYGLDYSAAGLYCHKRNYLIGKNTTANTLKL